MERQNDEGVKGKEKEVSLRRNILKLNYIIYENATETE